jgi:hypothetical protein
VDQVFRTSDRNAGARREHVVGVPGLDDAWIVDLADITLEFRRSLLPRETGGHHYEQHAKHELHRFTHAAPAVKNATLRKEYS